MALRVLVAGSAGSGRMVDYPAITFSATLRIACCLNILVSPSPFVPVTVLGIRGSK
jgi:hypothetical protein